IRETTDKPIRFVFDTHYHGDHVFGNAVFAREGAVAVAAQSCRDGDQEAMKTSFENWIQDKPEFQDLQMIEPSILFDERLVLDDGLRIVELLSYGRGHSPGDAVAYLPQERILFSGDLCVNGAYNYLGESNLDRWIEILEMLQGLDIEVICPGHGPIAGKELLQTQKDYLLQLRDQVQQGVEAGKSLEEIAQSIHIPLYEPWTGVPPRENNIRDAYRQITGLTGSWELVELGFQEDQTVPQDDPGWTPPKKMIIQGFDERQIKMLQYVAPGMDIIHVRSRSDIKDHIEDADALVGSIDPELLQAAKKLRWVHDRNAGVDRLLFPEFVQSSVILTNGQGTHGPSISDHVMGFMLMLSKGQIERYQNQLKGVWDRSSNFHLQELRGKTLLILGLGGIGGQIAKRAAAFDMTILAVDPQKMEKPKYVQAIVPPGQMHDLLPKADFVVSTVPLTKHTLRYFDKTCFDLMKPTAYFINIGRGKTVNQDDLIQALEDQTIAGAALDVTDPEPLPADHPLWKMDKVIITPHVSG
ncbi:MAG: NAD(P)-dependent oxidoreductase, partial [Candidatus Hinthialibacter sp.]